MSLKYLMLLFGTLAFVCAQKGAADKHIKYNVIGLLSSSQSMGVIVDNVTYALELNSPSTILYTGSAPVARQGYRYTKIKKLDNSTINEPFLRSPVETDTVNEFFNRTWNKKQIAPLPTVYKPLPFIHRISSKLHQEGEIPTIHIIANETEVALLHRNASQDIEIKTNLSYVSLNDSLSFQNVGLSIAGVSSRMMPKISYNLKLHKKDRIYGYRRIKLRAMAMDPSYMHEKLGYGMVKSLGLISTDFSYCRVFLNDQEIGLFGLIETFQDPWTANVFADGDKDYKGGNLYQGVGAGTNNTGGLNYLSNLTAYRDGQYKIKAGNKKDYAPLQELTKFIADAPVNGTDAVDAWKSKIDMDSVIRSMALEILNSYNDGYLVNANNYYIYVDPSSKKYTYIPSDLDLTFNVASSGGQSILSGNYSNFTHIYDRPLTNKMLKVPEFKQQFEETLVNVTKQLMNPTATNDHINSLTDMLQEDVAWDAVVPRLGTGFTNGLKSLNITIVNGRVPQDLDVESLVRKMASSPMFSQIPLSTDPAALKAAVDLMTFILKGLPFSQAVNGPSNNVAFMAIKEFIYMMSQNISKLYNLTTN
ncbi:hypothetical protein RMATCC62417_05453 [Rhizopus microsporus]|nr:hypothetical protein RMATCC62417_05453 [Rhizopus microsporus]